MKFIKCNMCDNDIGTFNNESRTSLELLQSLITFFSFSGISANKVQEILEVPLEPLFIDIS